MGRIAKPSRLRINEGMRAHTPLRPGVEHKRGAPDRPKLSAAGKRIWDELIENMDPLILRRVDKDALATLCEDEAQLAEAQACFNKLRRELPLAEALVSKEGKALYRMIREQTRSLVIQRREFGLTPSSRTRVIGGGGAESSESSIDGGIFDHNADLFVLPKAN